MPEAACKTRPYRPSNGTEGMFFDDAWCSNCERDRAWREDECNEPCDILTRTSIYQTEEPEYPIEWVEDNVPYPQNTHPRCTAFIRIGADTELEAARTDHRQLEFEL